MRQFAGLNAFLHVFRTGNSRFRRDRHERMNRRLFRFDTRKARARRFHRADLARLYLCAQLKGGQIK